ncbi:response regulator transcription factor, partial [Enterococcus faecalis]|nr:response regulator transcription factor [Enterococcus faecalis]
TVLVFFIYKESNIASTKQILSTSEIQDRFLQKYKLTSREEQILLNILAHKTNKEISKECYLAIGTVKFHTHNIYVKMNVNSRYDAISKYNEFLLIHKQNEVNL